MHSQAVGGQRTLELLWGTRAPSSRGPRPRVSLDDIAAAGVRWADTHGLTGLTLARVAGELGLTTTALYRYVDSKDALRELMVDRAVGMPPELRGATWQDRTRDWVRSLCRRYRQHPWVLQTQIAGPPRHPSALAWVEVLLIELDASPIGDPMHLALVLDGLARAFAVITDSTEPEAPPAWLRDIIGERFPRLSAELDRDWTDVDDELMQAVDIVLAGAEQLHDTAAPTSRSRHER